MTTGPIDFAATFAALAAGGEGERTVLAGGVSVRTVRVPGGGPGRWDSHDDGPEIAVVQAGEFSVEFRDHTLHLSAGQCCVVPAGAEHRGTSPAGAEVVLFRHLKV